MEKNKIIEISACISESSRGEKTRLLEEIVADVYDNRDEFKRAIMDCDKNKSFVTLTLDLGKLSKRIIEKHRLNLLIDGTLPLKRCKYCGCYYITYRSYTYRNNSECVSRSHECITCRDFRNEDAQDIYNIYQKSGVRAAKKYQFKLLKEENPVKIRNAENAELVKCIVFGAVDFEKIIQRIWGKDYEMDYSSCNVYIQKDKYSLNDDEVFPKLSEYFEVSSVNEVWYIEETKTVWIAYS